jgi:hypothetical protein
VRHGGFKLLGPRTKKPAAVTSCLPPGAGLWPSPTVFAQKVLKAMEYDGLMSQLTGTSGGCNGAGDRSHSRGYLTSPTAAAPEPARNRDGCRGEAVPQIICPTSTSTNTSREIKAPAKETQLA